MSTLPANVAAQNRAFAAIHASQFRRRDDIAGATAHADRLADTHSAADASRYLWLAACAWDRVQPCPFVVFKETNPYVPTMDRVRTATAPPVETGWMPEERSESGHRPDPMRATLAA